MKNLMVFYLHLLRAKWNIFLDWSPFKRQHSRSTFFLPPGLLNFKAVPSTSVRFSAYFWRIWSHRTYLFLSVCTYLCIHLCLVMLNMPQVPVSTIIYSWIAGEKEIFKFFQLSLSFLHAGGVCKHGFIICAVTFP